MDDGDGDGGGPFNSKFVICMFCQSSDLSIRNSFQKRFIRSRLGKWNNKCLRDNNQRGNLHAKLVRVSERIKILFIHSNVSAYRKILTVANVSKDLKEQRFRISNSHKF